MWLEGLWFALLLIRNVAPSVQNADFFSKEAHQTQQGDFRIRLQYCAQHTTATETNIKASLAKPIADAEKKVWRMHGSIVYQ
jgi:hypothetical protein